jgi:membrane-associated phospholipid phosphatase
MKMSYAKQGSAMRAAFVWLASLVAIAAMVTISFQWLDRPIALLIHDNLQRPHHGFLDKLTHIPDPLIPLAIIVFLVLGLRALFGRPLLNYQAAALVCSLSVIVTETIKDQLKFLFGRTWPETWVQDNPSLIRDGAFGFNFMHEGSAYQSFPSGHMAATCAVISVLWIWYPKLRALYVLLALAVAAGLIGANYHFLSDVIAGAFVGISIGWMATALWQMRGSSDD